jgi:hypothetical protein
LFLLLFQTDLAGPRKNFTYLFVIQPILTKLKINKVLLALSTKTLTNYPKQDVNFFRLAAESGCFYGGLAWLVSGLCAMSHSTRYSIYSNTDVADAQPAHVT